MQVSPVTYATRSEKEARRPMSKLLAIAASLKAVLIAASVAFARGDMVCVILISAFFSLAGLGAKPAGQAVPRDSSAVSQGDDPGR
jgi:hypothetical protein